MSEESSNKSPKMRNIYHCLRITRRGHDVQERLLPVLLNFIIACFSYHSGSFVGPANVLARCALRTQSVEARQCFEHMSSCAAAVLACLHCQTLSMRIPSMISCCC